MDPYDFPTITYLHTLITHAYSLSKLVEKKKRDNDEKIPNPITLCNKIIYSEVTDIFLRFVNLYLTTNSKDRLVSLVHSS